MYRTESGSRADLQREDDVCFERPVDVILWATRLYQSYKAKRLSAPDILEETFEGARLAYMYDALKRLVNRISTGANVRLQLHHPTCPRVALHEQALLTGLRCLQRGSNAEYEMTMVSILPLTLVRHLRSDLEIVASALSDIERIWPVEENTASNANGAAMPEASNVALH